MRRNTRPLGLPVAQVDVRIGTVCMTVTEKQVAMFVLLVDEIDRMMTSIRVTKEAMVRTSVAAAQGGAQLGIPEEVGADGGRRDRRGWMKYALSLMAGEGGEGDWAQ